MNRTIKFRGLRVDGKGWVYGYLGDTHLIYTKSLREFVVVIPSTVGQFTGILSKSGKEIYEGDTVLSEKWVAVGRYEKCTGVVFYKMCEFAIQCTGDWQGSHADLNGNAEIIGNIHEQ